MPSNFPLEILESIVDSLATEDDLSFSSTKACSLVSRSFLSRARTHIFRSIVINDLHHHPAPTPLMFARLITQTPEIAYYVTSLKYTVKTKDLLAVDFAIALSSLTSLKSLMVQLYDTKWKDMPFREIILSLMHLPTLAHLHVRNGDGLFLSDLTLCTGLKSLETCGCRTVEWGKDIEVYQAQPPHLESYVGGPHNSPSLLMKLCTARRTDGKPVIDFSGLKKLSHYVELDELDAITEWFRVCRQLVDVHLARSERLLIRTDVGKLFLSSIRTLKHVHLEFYISHPTDMFLPLVTTFTSLMGENVIESIKLSITVWLRVQCTYGDEWGALDRVFSLHEDGWKKLKTFSLYIDVRYGHDQQPIDVHELVQNLQELPATQLRGLARSDKIMFDFKVTTGQGH